MKIHAKNFNIGILSRKLYYFDRKKVNSQVNNSCNFNDRKVDRLHILNPKTFECESKKVNIYIFTEYRIIWFKANKSVNMRFQY